MIISTLIIGKAVSSVKFDLMHLCKLNIKSNIYNFLFFLYDCQSIFPCHHYFYILEVWHTYCK